MKCVFSLSGRLNRPKFPTVSSCSLQWTPTFHGVAEAELVVKLLKSVVSMATAALCALLSASAGVTAARKQARTFWKVELVPQVVQLAGTTLDDAKQGAVLKLHPQERICIF